MSSNAPSIDAGPPAAGQTSAANARLASAVQRSKPFSRAGLQEKLFTWAFHGLVYPQIWEDPVVDMEALALGPGDRMVTIASGGCNALSYLTSDPARIIAVDLNVDHVALVRLKQAGFRHAPSYQAFFRFFGDAAQADNVRFFDAHLAPHLDPLSRDYWEKRDLIGRRRVRMFKHNIYRRGLLGNFIGAGHVASRMLGVRLSEMLAAGDQAAQTAYFDAHIAPMFKSRFVRWITSFKASLFGLGIPPAQYDELAKEGDGDMSVVLEARLRKLLCDFPLSENYFAWQALGRRYATGDAGPLPPYLQSAHFETLRNRVDRLTVEQSSVTERIGKEEDRSLDGYVLLDAQDWMTDEQLNALWTEITRTAKPGARAIFRTADAPSLLPGRVQPALLDQWRYEETKSAELFQRDRSAIYGGFHLYVRKD